MLGSGEPKVNLGDALARHVDQVVVVAVEKDEVFEGTGVHHHFVEDIRDVIGGWLRAYYWQLASATVLWLVLQ